MTLTLTGSSAIDFVEAADASLLLALHADGDEPAREGVPWAEALAEVIYGGGDQFRVYVTISPESGAPAVWALAKTYPHTTS